MGSGSTGEIAGLSINTAGNGNAAASGLVASTTLSGQPRSPSASIVRLRDVGRVEMGSQNYRQAMTFDSHPSVGVAVFQLPGSNALDVAERVKAKMKELSKRFPEGVDYEIAYDTTPFIRESVADVFKTLFEAAALVGSGGAGLPAELAVGADPHDRHAGGHRRHVCASWPRWASA